MNDFSSPSIKMIHFSSKKSPSQSQPRKQNTYFSSPLSELSTSSSLHMHMKILINQYSFKLFFSAIVASSLVCFVLCLAAEFKKSKKTDIVIDGKLCYVPRSAAFELGIAALICLSITQVIGSLFIFRKLHSGEHSLSCNDVKPSVSCILLVFSWISYGVAVILMSGATSMNQGQPFGEGWLDGECYLVKDEVYVGSALLGLLALGSTLGSGAILIRRKQAEENRKVHTPTT